MPEAKPLIAVFSGPTATIGNSPPLVTSNQARARHGLPLHPGRFDVLRAQRLAAPVTVYIQARLADNLAGAALAGFVGEGANPYGLMNQTTDNALSVATFCGYPVVKAIFDTH